MSDNDISNDIANPVDQQGQGDVRTTPLKIRKRYGSIYKEVNFYGSIFASFLLPLAAGRPQGREEKHADQLGRSSEQYGSRQDSLPCRNCNWGTLRSPRGLLYISMFVSPCVCRASSA